MHKILCSFAALAAAIQLISCAGSENAAEYKIWQIGLEDGSSAEFALAPDGYNKFIENDFGFEDGYFIVGHDAESEKFPYILPGIEDEWAGSMWASGYRAQWDNILFSLDGVGAEDSYSLVINLLECAPEGCVLKYIVNGVQSGSIPIKGNSAPSQVRFDFGKGVIRSGGNEIKLTISEGSWIVFDNLELLSDRKARLQKIENVFIRDVKVADYQIDADTQPVLVDVETLSPGTQLEVKLGSKTIFSKTTEDTRRHIYEVPMKSVKSARKSKVTILSDGKEIYKGNIKRTPCRTITPAEYVDTRIGTAHSRWMIAPGPWMPMSMVKLSPDNQRECWQGGYDSVLESIGCFSHIHEWTMAGLGLMPTSGELHTRPGGEFAPESGYRSRMDCLSENAPIGYYKVHLTDTDIDVMLSATTRCGFHKYTFPKGSDGRVMIDFHIPAEYCYELPEVNVRQVSDSRIEGSIHQLTPRPEVWSDDCDQDYTLHFVMEFDQSIVKGGSWQEDRVSDAIEINAKNLQDAGLFVEFNTDANPTVQIRVGISLVSIANAAENLEKEISEPFGWDIDAVAAAQIEVWNDILGRAVITTDDRMEKTRFYTNMYRAMCRNTWSDIGGDWVAPDETVHHLDSEDERALGCDAFWNTFWNLNQFWNLFTPEWSSRWVKSQLALYDACGWLAKGPAGMEYVPVMVGEHEIPQMVSAWQMGIRDYDSSKLLEAVVKMQTTPAGQVAGGFAGNRDLVPYLRYHYVPHDKGTFSNSLEYSYDDWCVAQLAKSLGDEKTFRTFSERGEWWRNAICPEDGYAHLRTSDGKFIAGFDPLNSKETGGYTEGNGWQLTYFVPQNVAGLAELIGREEFVRRLNWGFEKSEPFRYNAPNEEYGLYPVVQGNQQSMHFAFLFNYAGCPHLTQKWSRSILERYYGYGPGNAYLGDEDQGQMSAWFVMAAIGLFQTDGGCSAEPFYEIASPLYEKVEINLGGRYGRGDKFTIEAHGVSAVNKYVQSAVLNGKPLNDFRFPAAELLKGGSLVLEMGPTPGPCL